MIITVAAWLAVVVVSVVMMTFVVGALRVLWDGVDVADQLDRAGYGPSEFWNGVLPRQDASASAGTTESLDLVASAGQVSVRPARTISRELF